MRGTVCSRQPITLLRSAMNQLGVVWCNFEIKARRALSSLVLDAHTLSPTSGYPVVSQLMV
jgi:hypothetical protein